MLDRVGMQQMINEALQELDLDYRPAALFEPRDQHSMWCVDLLDYAAPQFERTFQVCVEWTDASTYDSLKADLKAKLASKSAV